MTPTTREQDLGTLSRLNADDLASDQNSGVARYEQFLAPEFTASLLGDVALVHARMTLRTLQGALKHGRYTDEYQKRDGTWRCIDANVISEAITADTGAGT